MFESFVRKKAVEAKDAVVDSVVDDIQSSPGLSIGAIGILGFLASCLLKGLFGGKAQSPTQTSVINNIYITKGDYCDED